MESHQYKKKIKLDVPRLSFGEHAVGSTARIDHWLDCDREASKFSFFVIMCPLAYQYKIDRYVCHGAQQ